MDKLLLKPEEAFALIGLGRSTGYSLLARGVLPSIRVGGSVRVPVEELRQWVARQVAGDSSLADSAAGRAPAARR